MIQTSATVLRQRYPTWFAKMAFYDLSLPEGWAPLLFEVCEKIDAELRNQRVVRLMDRKHFRIMQIKEKFGTLRVYTWGAPAAVREIITEAEITSEMICLRCGNPGVLRDTGSVIATLCEDHHAEVR